MKKHIVLISVILLLSANKGCSPACNKEQLPVRLMDENYRSYVDFPEGSYWIYKDPGNTDIKDSIYLKRRSYYQNDSGQDAPYVFDGFLITSTSSYYDDDFKSFGGGVMPPIIWTGG
jgi:hypothetical protein